MASWPADRHCMDAWPSVLQWPAKTPTSPFAGLGDLASWELGLDGHTAQAVGPIYRHFSISWSLRVSPNPRLFNCRPIPFLLHSTTRTFSTPPVLGTFAEFCSRHYACPPCIFLRSPLGQCTRLAPAKPLTRHAHWPCLAPPTCLLLSAPCCTCCTCRELQAGLMWLLVT